MSERLRVHPPGPYPPHGEEVAGEVDLGIRLRDLLYTRHTITGWARRALGERLGIIARDPMRLAMARGWIDDLPQTWPLGHLIDDARERWAGGPDGQALAVLLKASNVLSPVLGWPTSLDRRWPMPDPEWVVGQVGKGRDVVVVPRAQGDGATGLSIVLEAQVEAASLHDPRILRAGIDEIEDAPEHFIAALGDGAQAVQITTPGPSTTSQREAWERVRSAGAKQHLYERGGSAGLLVDELPRFADLLGDAPAGKPGKNPRTICDLLFLPSLSDEGEVGVVGVLAWDAPYHPIRVVPGAAEILRRLDGEATLAEVAADLEVEESTVQSVVDQLIGIGAASAE
ncbi:MAG: hypothetical protein KC912_19890 [Proteobacteria bacterium]|nr:hypothetical protein [Pseudomonadota bacterium]